MSRTSLRSLGIGLLFSLLATSCSMPSGTATVISSLRFSPSAFDSFKRNTELRYTLKEPARVSAVVVKRGSPDLLVKSLFSDLDETTGSHAHTWLGDTDAGRFAPSGDYVAVVTTANERSEATVTIFHY
jgi:flagellar hook assembly protein FlgD